MSLSIRSVGIGLMIAAGGLLMAAFAFFAVREEPLAIPLALVAASLVSFVLGAALYDMRSARSHVDPALSEPGLSDVLY